MHAELLYAEKSCIGCGSCAAACPNGVHGGLEKHEIDRERCCLCGACVSACPTAALRMSGTERRVEEILDEVEKDRAFYGSLGGMTLSGGEPFAQKQATLALLRAAKARGIGTAVETCGYAETSVLQEAVSLVDLFLWDIKDTDGERHKQYTGVTHEPILQNLYAADALGARIRLRCILVNGVNTDRAHYQRVAEIACSLHQCDGVELIAYHAYGGSKCLMLGKEDNGNTAWIPTAGQLTEAKGILADRGISVTVQGAM